MGERKGTRGLELWCRRLTEGYPGVKIENMTTSWRDGLAFCAIIHHFRPDLIDFHKLKQNDIYHNNELAFRIAEHHLGIPALLEPEDMVEFPVPDRLSILTYLSQFYQAFAVQGQSTRIASKRAQSPPDHSVVSPASTSPPSKVALIGAGRIRREPCAKCSLPVYIAERLNVGKQLYHRTCFRCARCASQLTLDNYYETENSEFCCETCPDEEKLTTKLDTVDHSILTRSMSDEEKTANLKATEPDDEYSAEFETALEFPEDGSLKRNSTLTLEQSKEFTMARSAFLNSQVESSDSGNENEEDDKPPDLPRSAQPEIESELADEERSSLDVISSAYFDSGFPNHNKLDSSVNSVSDSKNQYEEINIVTKDDEIAEEDQSSSLVKTRMQLFESKPIDDQVPVDTKIELSPVSDSKPTDDSIITISDDSVINVESSAESDVSKIEPTQVEEPKVEIIEENVETKEQLEVKQDLEVKEETVNNSEEIYPDDLNPFDDDEDQPEASSQNPFGEEEEDGKPKPSPRLRRKLITSSETRPSIYIPRLTVNPFGSEDEEAEEDKPPKPATRVKKLVPKPRISLNPFGSDDEEEGSVKLPVPTPRSRTALGASTNSSEIASFGSNSSISSSAVGTLRKKKPAPKPPAGLVVRNEMDSASSSLASSPCHSLQHSPRSTPKYRKTKKAPLPPTSTPSNQLATNENPSFNAFSPINLSLKFDGAAKTNNEYEPEKIAKDEMNRNRQSQILNFNSPTSSENSSSCSLPNKSTYGKWKRRKGQAPTRPIPQKRTIKVLPMDDVRRELDIIEIQLQGLEKQGVRLEHIIRDKCEGPSSESNMEDSLPPVDAEELILQLFELVNEKNELFRKQAELMYLKRQQRLEEEHADVEYQIRCLMLQPEANKTDSDKAKEEELISRLVDIVERRNEIIECLEMDRKREAEEDDSINNHLNLYSMKKDEKPTDGISGKKDKKKNKKEKRFKFKSSSKKVDADKDIDETEIPSSTTTTLEKKKKKKLHIF